MFESLLVANRGEIACRILRTARRLGLRTIAVYSDADSGAPHVALADHAVRLGPPPVAESYLDVEAVIAAAERTGAAALHPGYGFLSENPALASACERIGCVFVGPPVAAIEAMAAKDAAKRIAEAEDVPLLPGYHAEARDDAALTAAADALGFPLLVKAVAGGGGRGMRVVRAPEALEAALTAARREALAAFGDERLLLERWLDRPRHVEVQICADVHGEVAALFDRDCSVQRRQQKVVEEAPAPGLSASLRERMAAAAVRLARAVDYVGAGTVEFLVEDDGFYFLEMNTRLQVEHPVTEAVTGIDLVEWQLRVAAGEALPATAGLVPAGHAIEARVYAEDPAHEFLPSTGRLERLQLPGAAGGGVDADGVRVDSGVREGDTVSPFYDPLLAKVVVHGADRGQALARLRRALARCRVHGVTTNLALLRAIVAAPDFAADPVATNWLDAQLAALLAASDATGGVDPRALAALAVVLARAPRSAPAQHADSPWVSLPGFRLNAPRLERVRLAAAGEAFEVGVSRRRDGFALHLDGTTYRLSAWRDADGLVFEADDLRERLETLVTATHVTLLGPRLERTFERRDALELELERETVAPGSLVAPMPGQVVQVAVAVGAQVEAGATLMVLEAMKIEHSMVAPHPGEVMALHYQVGDRVEEGATLAELREPAGSD